MALGPGRTQHLLILARSQRFWLGVFAVWLFLLTGLTRHWFGATGPFGSPGIWQQLSLNQLLKERTEQLKTLQSHRTALQKQVELLTHNRFEQEREVRRVLGYAGPHDIIFDFTSESESPNN